MALQLFNKGGVPESTGDALALAKDLVQQAQIVLVEREARIIELLAQARVVLLERLARVEPVSDGMDEDRERVTAERSALEQALSQVETLVVLVRPTGQASRQPV